MKPKYDPNRFQAIPKVEVDKEWRKFVLQRQREKLMEALAALGLLALMAVFVGVLVFLVGRA